MSDTPVRFQGREYIGREDWPTRAASLKSGAATGLGLWTCALPGGPSAPEEMPTEDRARRFVISSERTDRYGDIVIQAGGDRSTYHDVVLWAHDYGFFAPPAPPIGQNLSFGSTTTADGYAATTAVVRFAGREQNHELAETIYLLARDGFPLDASIGFEPVEWTEDRGGYTFLRWNLIEWSVCPIGANTDARRLAAYSQTTKSALQPLRAFAERTLAGIGGEPGQWIPKATLEAIAKALGQQPAIFDLGTADLAARLAKTAALGQSPAPEASAAPVEPDPAEAPADVTDEPPATSDSPTPAPEAAAPAADPLGSLAALLFAPQRRSSVSEADFDHILRELRPAIAADVQRAIGERVGHRAHPLR